MRKRARNIVVDVDEIDRDAPLVEVEEPHRHRRRMSEEHIARLKRKHRRQRMVRRLIYGGIILLWVGAIASVGFAALSLMA